MPGSRVSFPFTLAEWLGLCEGVSARGAFHARDRDRFPGAAGQFIDGVLRIEGILLHPYPKGVCDRLGARVGSRGVGTGTGGRASIQGKGSPAHVKLRCGPASDPLATTES